MAHLFCRIGVPASWKEVVAMLFTPPKPPLTYFSFFRMVPARSTASTTRGSLKGMPWVVHWS